MFPTATKAEVALRYSSLRPTMLRDWMQQEERICSCAPEEISMTLLQNKKSIIGRST